MTHCYAVANIIITEWPDFIKDIPKSLKPYQIQCDLLTMNGIILCGEAIVAQPG